MRAVGLRLIFLSTLEFFVLIELLFFLPDVADQAGGLFNFDKWFFAQSYININLENHSKGA